MHVVVLMNRGLLFADRMSAETMRANQLRLYLSAAAYVLVEALRRLALKGTEMAQSRVYLCARKNPTWPGGLNESPG